MENLIALEKKLLGIYGEIKREIPNLNHVTFELSEWGQGKVRGWYHIGNECKSYDNINDLAILASSRKEARGENEILFRKFG